jgi:hypothetical protein
MKSYLKIIFFVSILVLTSNCSKDEVNNTQLPSNGVIPTVTTIAVENITNNSAIVNGKITNTGNSSILSKGIVWSTNPNPTISDNKKEDSSSSNMFSLQFTNLNRNTTYYIRAFATNISGTSYGQELTCTTLNNYLMFSTNSQIYKNVLQNTQDKILYLITYDSNAGTRSNFNLIAYDYINKTVIQQKTISQFETSVGSTTHSISSYNNQLELYIVSSHAISILNPITLQIINTINFPSSKFIAGVEQKNGLLFTSYTDNNSGDSKIAVYNRNTLNLINETITGSNFAALTVYNDLTNPNNTKCLCFPQFSNGSFFTIETYDNNGNCLPFSIGTNYGEGSISRTRDDINFIIKGDRGRIYFKNNLDNNSTTLSSDQYLTDYKLSSDGNHIYTIESNPNNYYKIPKYNTTNFTIDSFITINERSPKNLFIDNNNYFIVDYDSYATQKQVFLSVY